jgi:hypothetical protein
MNEVVLIVTDTREGLYINGDLVLESDCITPSDLLALLADKRIIASERRHRELNCIITAVGQFPAKVPS